MSALPCVGGYQPRKGLISPLTSRGRWSWVRPSDRSIAARTAVPASRSGGSIPGAASLEGTGRSDRLAESSAVTAAEKTVFARKTSGLVKELGAFESFSINLISLGPGPAYGLFLIVLLFVSGANLIQATLLAALAGIPVVLAYTIMSIEMPRSGGEYVYASRLLHPYLGFVGGLARVLNAIVYAAILPYWFVIFSLGPGLASWGSVVGDSGIANVGTTLTSNTTWIVVIGEILTVAVMVLWIVMKPRLAFRIF